MNIKLKSRNRKTITRIIKYGLRGFFIFIFITYPYFVNAQKIELDKKIIDFGKVKEGTILNYAVEVKNASDKILRIGIRSSCECITVSPERIDLKSTQKAPIKIKIDTTGYSQSFKEKVFFQSNDPENPYIAVTIKGIIETSAKKIISSQHKRSVSKEILTLPITIFDSVGCKFCLQLRQNIIPSYQKKYNIKIELTEYNIDEPKNYAYLIGLEEKYGRTLNKIPVVFVGDDVVGGGKEILQALPSIIEKYINLGECKKVEIPSIKISEQSVIQKLKIFPVILAGIVDSVNPCAFATIIFFLTYISLVLKKQRYEIFLTGLIFIIGVFITYFLIGVGFFKAIQQLRNIQILSKIMYIIIGVVALFLGFRHFYEALLIKRKGRLDEEDIKLKLPEVLRTTIYNLIKKFTSLKYILPLVFIMAIIITLLELVCTGQVYLPTIMYLVSLPDYRATATLYLLLYCLLFVLPLILIFGLFYFGLTTEKLKRFFSHEVFTFKLIMSVFFLILGLAILVNTLF